METAAVIELNHQTALTLDAVLGALGVSNSDLGRRLEQPPQWVQQRRRGPTRIKAADLTLIADALEIPVSVLTMRRSDALRWIADQWDSGTITSNYAAQLDFGLAA